MTNEDGKFRYRIQVEGTGIDEYYQFDENLDKLQVGKIWYQDVKEKYGAIVASSFKGKVKISQLTDPPEGKLQE